MLMNITLEAATEKKTPIGRENNNTHLQSNIVLKLIRTMHKKEKCMQCSIKVYFTLITGCEHL